MQRKSMTGRADWVRRMEDIGFTIHDASSGDPYWCEDRAYVLSSAEIDCLEEATNNLHALCLQAVEHVVQAYKAGDFAPIAAFDIPETHWPMVVASWGAAEPDVYGRFDLCYDGKGPPKLFEYNADTPTSLYEAAVVQYLWLKDVRPEHEQWNLLHDALIKAWQAALPDKPCVHFMGHLESREDFITLEYLRDTCAQAGCMTKVMNITALGYETETKSFFDEAGSPITTAFKLYPWEWLTREDAGGAFLDSSCRWIEPAWKMLLSNKALLPLLWRLFPEHPNLLPAWSSRDEACGDYVVKPKLSREGANITIHKNGEIAQKTDGVYDESSVIYQAFSPLPNYDGFHPVLGAWVVAGKAAGLGIREERNLVTTNMSYFVPHYIEDNC